MENFAPTTETMTKMFKSVKHEFEKKRKEKNFSNDLQTEKNIYLSLWNTFHDFYFSMHKCRTFRHRDIKSKSVLKQV